MSDLAPALDDAKRAALDRLTEREKDCLRRRLLPQTAKEMALDLGVSVHAVEKRLKMARAKLGVSASLEAARWLAAREGVRNSGPQSPDLDVASQSAKPDRTYPLFLGAFVMSFAAIALITVLMDSGDDAASAFDLPRSDEITVSLPATFETLDRDKSGYLEGEEYPKIVRVAGKAELTQGEDGEARLEGKTMQIFDNEGIRKAFYAEADRDDDQKVSTAEFEDWRLRRSRGGDAGSPSGEGAME